MQHTQLYHGTLAIAAGGWTSRSAGCAAERLLLLRLLLLWASTWVRECLSEQQLLMIHPAFYAAVPKAMYTGPFMADVLLPGWCCSTAVTAASGGLYVPHICCATPRTGA